MSGDLPAGTALSELALARDLGLSRTPLREAIGQMLAEGLLEQIPNRGTVVVQLTRPDIVDLFELREALEIYAVRKAGPKGIPAASVAKLRQTLEETAALTDGLRHSKQPALNREQMQRFMLADLNFHTVLLYSAGNRRILKVVNDTRLLIRLFGIRHQGHTLAELEEIQRQHTRILDELLAGSTEAAATCLTEHIHRSMQERLDAFDDAERESTVRWIDTAAGPLLTEAQ